MALICKSLPQDFYIFNSRLQLNQKLSKTGKLWDMGCSVDNYIFFIFLETFAKKCVFMKWCFLKKSFWSRFLNINTKAKWICFRFWQMIAFVLWCWACWLYVEYWWLCLCCRSRFLRKFDRDSNKDCYPQLHYPELYLLEGGYKNFYENQKVRTWGY